MKKCFRSILLLPLLALASSAYADLSDMPPGDYGLDKSHAYITFSYYRSPITEYRFHGISMPF